MNLSSTLFVEFLTWLRSTQETAPTVEMFQGVMAARGSDEGSEEGSEWGGDDDDDDDDDDNDADNAGEGGDNDVDDDDDDDDDEEEEEEEAEGGGGHDLLAWLKADINVKTGRVSVDVFRRHSMEDVANFFVAEMRSTSPSYAYIKCRPRKKKKTLVQGKGDKSKKKTLVQGKRVKSEDIDADVGWFDPGVIDKPKGNSDGYDWLLRIMAIKEPDVLAMVPMQGTMVYSPIDSIIGILFLTNKVRGLRLVFLHLKGSIKDEVQDECPPAASDTVAKACAAVAALAKLKLTHDSFRGAMTDAVLSILHDEYKQRTDGKSCPAERVMAYRITHLNGKTHNNDSGINMPSNNKEDISIPTRNMRDSNTSSYKADRKNGDRIAWYEFTKEYVRSIFRENPDEYKANALMAQLGVNRANKIDEAPTPKLTKLKERKAELEKHTSGR